MAEGSTAVTTLTATDPENDPLTWSIPAGMAGGADGGAFSLTATGVLTFTAAPDYEASTDDDEDNVYAVTVEVSDGTNATPAALEVTVEDVAPGLAGPTTARHPEGKRGLRIAAYSVDDDVTWSLTGDDAAQFTIAGGFLRFVDPPDYENAADADTDNVYNVTVQADDGTATEMTGVAVTVTNIDEPGVVTLSTLNPRLGTALTATLADPDTMSGTPTWLWERSTGPNAWVVIIAATSSSYTPVAADTGHYLRATATYRGGFGTGRSVAAVAPNVVLARRLRFLDIETQASKRPYPNFHPDTLHYAVRCGASVSDNTGRDTLTLRLAAYDADTRLAVDGQQVANPQATNQTTTVTLDVLRASDIPITLTSSDGAATTYVVHCLARTASRYRPFPRIQVSKHAGAWDGLISFAARGASTDHIAIVDTNGVPRFRRQIERVSTHFRTHKDGKYPYSYPRGTGVQISNSGLSREVLTFEQHVLDANLDEVATIQTVSPLKHTDPHDFVIKPNGNYVLMAYEPARRDFTRFTEDYGLYYDPDDHRVVYADPDRGDPLGPNQPTADSVIQIVDPLQPAGSQEVFRWNSWDHMALEDCTQHRFPDGYAHINSLQAVDDDIVASFRGCSQILRIATPSGNVVWRLGRSNRSNADWISQSEAPPLAITGDPYGEFCAQHSARIINNGNLVLFDNGVNCLVDPVTRESVRPSNRFSRVVEYAIDSVNGEAAFQRHHSLNGTFSFVGDARGHIEELDNGNWLISWSGSGATEESVTEWNPRTGREVLTLNIGPERKPLLTRAYPVNPEALAPRSNPLTAIISDSASNSGFHSGSSGRPTVVVAFNQPVVDLAADTPSVIVTGATVDSVTPHIAVGEVAHAYRFTLTPAGDERITLTLLADQPCASGGICTAGGAVLSTVPLAHAIPGPVTVAFEAGAYSVTEGGAVDIRVELNRAHGRAADVAIPLAVSGTATRDDDYAVPMSVTFSPTARTKTESLTALADLLVEGEETIEVGFGDLPGGVTAGSTATTVVTITDTTTATLSFQVSNAQVAEGNATALKFAAGPGITFTTAQTITLTLGGTATVGTDYTLAVGGTLLSAPYTVQLPAGANAATVTLTAENDLVQELLAETITVSAQHGTTALGSRSLTIPPSDTTLPVVRISGPSGRPAEGTALAFTLTRTGETTAALPVTVAVSETVAMLTATPPTTVTFPIDAASVALSVPTVDDTVVEADSTMTVTVQTPTPATYEVGVPQAASVTVRDNDTAIFALTVIPEEIVEGADAEVRVAIDNGVTFATDQAISLALTGEATAGDDYTVAAETLTLPAGVSEVTTTLTTVDDTDEEGAELLTVTATHETTRIGSASLTIEASDVPPAISITAGSEVDEGAPVVFTLTREKVTEPNELPELTVAVTVTDTYGRLSEEPPSTVMFGVGDTTTELRLATTNDTVILMDPTTEEPLADSEVTVTVLPAEMQTPPAYTVVDGADTAQVMVTENDVADFALSVDKTAVTEGEEVSVTVSITNGVTFSASHTIPIFAQDTGTATLGNGNAPGGDYTVHAPQGNERDHIRLRRNRNAASATIRVRDDARAEAAETIRLVVRHPGTETDIGTAEITIAASDQVGRLQRAEIVGTRLRLTFAEGLDADHPPPLAAFEVKAGAASGPLSAQAIESVTVSDRTVVVVLEASVPTSHLVQVSYTDPTAGDDARALQNTTGADVESWRNEPVRPVRPPRPTPAAIGGGGEPADVSPVPEPVGYLENPGANSFQSGIGVISGWVCEAEEVEIEIETESGAIMRLGAAYGTERLDTAGGCGDTDNGFGLLFNWNLLGDGEHEVVAFVDGIELARATVTVTTLGHEFLRDVTGTCEAEDFPTLGETVTLVWQQTSQNFVLAGGPVPDGENRARTGGVGYLENPGPHAFQSGVGVISGWVCEADEVLIELDGQAQPAGYGTERLDTQEVCGDTDNGFGLLFNWNLLGDGEHVVVARVDGEELGRATVRVTTLGVEFLRGAEGECTVEDFPTMGETVTLEWQQNSQNFVIADVE